MKSLCNICYDSVLSYFPSVYIVTDLFPLMTENVVVTWESPSFLNINITDKIISVKYEEV